MSTMDLKQSEIKYINFIIKQKYILSLLGLWPYNNLKYSFIYNLNALLTSFGVSYTFLFTLTMDMVINYADKEALADASYYFLTQLTFVIKFTTFVLKRNKFLTILDTLDSNIFNHDEKHDFSVKKWLRFATIFINNYLIVCYTVWVFYTIFPILDNDPNNILPFKGYFPFDVRTNMVNRYLVYGFQVFGLGSAIAINVSLDSILTALLNVGSAQIEVLKRNLENSSKESEQRAGTYKIPDIFDNKTVEIISDEAEIFLNDVLVKCVEHHKAIIKFLTDVEEVFGIGMFMQFVSSGIIICITGLQLILIPATSIKFYSITSYFVAMIVQISAYCWNGHDVIVQSSSISDSCYQMDWYRSNPKIRKILFIIMERSKIPLKISAGKFFILSITTLTTIFRTAYSYFAVLQRLYKDK